MQHGAPAKLGRMAKSLAVRLLLGSILAALLVAPGRTTPLDWELHISQPPIVQDSTRPRQCTVTWLVADTGTNDVYAVRMQIAPTDDARPQGGRLPCPSSVPVRMAERALDACTARAADARSCVYADMSRGFEAAPEIRNTAENASRCSSDKATAIGIACWHSGRLDVCDVACGATPAAAETAAQARCKDKHQRTCTTAGSVPVLAPE
jgi:hypothetical protein